MSGLWRTLNGPLLSMTRGTDRQHDTESLDPIAVPPPPGLSCKVSTRHELQPSEMQEGDLNEGCIACIGLSKIVIPLYLY